jgi:hypothetical protein
MGSRVKHPSDIERGTFISSYDLSNVCTVLFTGYLMRSSKIKGLFRAPKYTCKCDKYIQFAPSTTPPPVLLNQTVLIPIAIIRVNTRWVINSLSKLQCSVCIVLSEVNKCLFIHLILYIFRAGFFFANIGSLDQLLHANSVYYKVQRYHIVNNFGYHSQGSPPHKIANGYKTDVWKQPFTYMFYI